MKAESRRLFVSSFIIHNSSFRGLRPAGLRPRGVQLKLTAFSYQPSAKLASSTEQNGRAVRALFLSQFRICVHGQGHISHNTRLCQETPSLARERAVFGLARTAKQAILNVSTMQPDAVQARNKPLEARPSFLTQPNIP